MSETRVVHPAPQPKAVPEKPSRASAEEVNEEEVYQGTVRLNVEGNSDIRCLVQFVEGLRQKPQLRLLQLVGNHKDGVSIWVGLREPLWLKKILLGMEHVSRVSTPLGKAPNGSERLLRVCLTKPLLP